MAANVGIFDKFRLDGKVVLVTGAGKNLGKAIAVSLAEAGADIAVTSRTFSEVEQTAEEIEKMGKKALAMSANVNDFSQIEKVVNRVVSEFGRIDILVNNAAIFSLKPLLEIPEEEWREVIDTNLTGAFLCCKAVGPFMIRQGGGRIINISSRAGGQGVANQVAYCASKAGLNLLTRALAVEWAPYNILVNAVAPGQLSMHHSPDDITDKKVAMIPLKRGGEFAEVVPVVLLLASEASTFITGELIFVDGGRSCC